MTVLEDNLLPFEGTVKAGQRLVKVGDSWMPVGVGGNFEPGKVSLIEIGRGTYYQCNTVDETANTWTGYALVLDGQYYTIAETLTEGLTYGKGYTPKVGKIYNDEATVLIKGYNRYYPIPTDGLIFYAPLESASDTAETGQTLVTTGTVTYGTVDGIPCATMGSDSSQKITSTFTLSETGSYSVSAYVSEPSKDPNRCYPFAIGGSSSGSRIALYTDYQSSTNWSFNYGGGSIVGYPVTYPTGWKHVCFTYDEPTTTCKMYIDGVLIGTGSYNVNITEGNCFIFTRPDGTYSAAEGTSVAGFRVYNRVLTEDEIIGLYKEYN